MNMEDFIEIRGHETEALYVQLYRKVFWIIPVISAVIYGIYLLKTWLSDDVFMAKLIITALFVLCGFVFTRFPTWMAKRAYKARMKYYSGVLPEEVCRFGEEISIVTGDATQKIPYDKISKIFFLESGIAFKLKDHRVIGISNEGFAKGSMEALKVLLREKCPNIKIPE